MHSGTHTRLKGFCFVGSMLETGDFGNDDDNVLTSKNLYPSTGDRPLQYTVMLQVLYKSWRRRAEFTLGTEKGGGQGKPHRGNGAYRELARRDRISLRRRKGIGTPVRWTNAQNAGDSKKHVGGTTNICYYSSITG